MATYLKPRRGKKTTAEKLLVGDAKLKKGEIFFEVNEKGVGQGSGKIKFGDGVKNYNDLPYFIDPENASDSIIEFTEADDKKDGLQKSSYELINKTTLSVLLTKIAGSIRNFHNRIIDLTKAVESNSSKITELEKNSNNVLTMETVLETLYPVGSVVMTTVNYTADTIKNRYGGNSWERIESGRYLRTASGDDGDKSNSKGGNNSTTYKPAGSVGDHELTVNEIPSHKHGFSYDADVSHGHTFTEGGKAICIGTKESDNGIDSSDVNDGFSHSHNTAAGGDWWVNTKKKSSTISNSTINLSIDQDTENTGGSTAHNHTFSGTQSTITITPKYYTVYVWKRLS